MKSDSLNAIIGNFSSVEDDNKKYDEDATKLETKVFNPARDDGQTRNKLTITFLKGFFGLLIFSCVFVLAYNYFAVGWAISLSQAKLDEAAKSITFLELDKILSIIIGALGTSLGFIIGYYFKEKSS
ncbi:hypothetical protein NGI19_08590 [Raoultella ornithinolytica]|uniref:hypothetical protein n=1 Tax=Raoultella ornithinolytica TaxID=54291 RepID=UPI002DB78522|nr:hypothetical protein [Raoultella ornithinolytica]MEB7993459.1 hypothetical protein [Raoultella ornithinolytica]